MNYLADKVLQSQNLRVALKSVVRNKGASGVDNLEVSELKSYLNKNWFILKSELETGQYLPKPILGIEIPKSNGGKRLLGIPTVFDRFVQQAINQVLQAEFDSSFSEFSYGFRPKRCGTDAVLKTQEFINQGFRYIVDIDLSKFFDMVNHDYLMSQIYQRVKDPILHKLILRFLRAPILISGGLRKRRKGVPQGSPLSPILSNIILDNLDKESERLGLHFVRYADDFCVFLKSKSKATKVFKYLEVFINESLHLKVNQTKSSIVRPQNFEFLGYGFVSSYKRGDRGIYQLVVSKSSLKSLKTKIKQITRKTTPASFTERILRLRQLMYGWLNYFKYANIQLKLRDLDSWVRSRLRYCIWHHWKKPNKRMRSYIRLGVKPGIAYAWSRSRMGGWAIALSPILRTTITINRLKQRGYISFSEYYSKTRN